MRDFNKSMSPSGPSCKSNVRYSENISHLESYPEDVTPGEFASALCTYPIFLYTSVNKFSLLTSDPIKTTTINYNEAAGNHHKYLLDTDCN